MKKFLKKNLWLIIGFTVSIILIFLGMLVSVCLIIGALLMGVFLLCLAHRFKKRYNAFKDEMEEDDTIFDGTVYDYDEDVYVIGTKPVLKNKLKKGLISNISALIPTIVCSFSGLGLIVISVTLLIKIIF